VQGQTGLLFVRKSQMQERKLDLAAFPPTYSDYFINSTHQEFLMDYLLHLQLNHFDALKEMKTYKRTMYRPKSAAQFYRVYYI